MDNTITVELTPKQISMIVEMMFENYSSLDDEQTELYELLSQSLGGGQ
jgi:hypothetical protein